MKKLKTISKYKEWILVMIIGVILIYMAVFLKLENLINFINKTLPAREASLAAGMILGDKNGFDKLINKDLKNSGLMHLVVISGANLMILMRFIINSLAGWLNRKKAIIIGILFTWSFVGLVGWQVSVLRAVLMVSIIYWAQLLGRKFSVVRSTILVFILMILIDYKFLGEVSFWLSFTAYIGVVTSKNKWSLLWVPLWTTPVLAIYFGQISLISPITNGLVIGVAETVTVIGLAGIMLGQFFSYLGAGVLLLILPILRYFLYITELFGKLSFASVMFKFNGWMLAGWYLILTGYCVSQSQKK